MKIIERLKELRAKEKDAPTLVAMSITENATKNAAYAALPALIECAEQAKILVDAIDELERAVSAVCGKTPESGMLTKPIRDALANLEG